MPGTVVSWQTTPVRKLLGRGSAKTGSGLKTRSVVMEFASFITVSAGIFHTPARLAEFKKFFEPKIDTPGLTREIKMDIRIIESKVALVEKEQAAVNAAVAKAI